MTPKLPIRTAVRAATAKRSDAAAAVKAVMRARETDSVRLVDRRAVRKLVERPRK
jgi:hypothetical protein